MTTINEWSSQQQDQLKVYDNLMDDIEDFFETTKGERRKGKTKRRTARRTEKTATAKR